MNIPRSHTILALLVLLPLLLGCTSAPNLPTSSTQSPVPMSTAPSQSEQFQGVQGRVLEMRGDFMPGPGPARGETQPISTEVWVFSGRIPSSGMTWPVAEAEQHPGFVRKVTSNEVGEFSVELPPGEYTLFARYDSNLYLNSFQGDGSFTSVQVTPGATTTFDLVNSANATF